MARGADERHKVCVAASLAVPVRIACVNRGFRTPEGSVILGLEYRDQGIAQRHVEKR
jgi:hypothetical protein